MIICDLNNLSEKATCGGIARWLITEKGNHPNELIQFMRGDMKIFTKNFKLSYWAKTRVKESTDGEWMKTVPYYDSFQLRSPCQMDSEIRVTPENNPTYQTAH